MSLRMPPGFSIDDEPRSGQFTLHTPEQPDAYGKHGRTFRTLDLDEDQLPADPQERALVMLLVHLIHEGFEWVTVNGQQYAEPHPDPSEMEHWNWLVDESLALLRRYRAAFPADRVAS